MKNSESLGKGIIILSVLNLISLICVGAFVMFVILVGSTNFEGQLATMNMTPMVPFIIVLIAGVIMILRKNKLGVYIYFGSIILMSVFAIVAYGFKFTDIGSSIGVFLYAYFIYRKWNLFN